MQMSGEQTISAHREKVWKALNEPQVLKDCIPGCESITTTGDNQYAIVMMAAVGPVKARFNAKLVLSEIVAPTSYTLTFDGSGGAAGFGKGRASVLLADEAGGSTRLGYQAQAQVGGKLAQVGSRLIDGVAKKLADEFFARFKQRVETPAAAPQAALGASSVLTVARPPSEPEEASIRSISVWTWTAVLIACYFGVYWYFRP
jgi:uncharacterized protein